MVNDLRWRRQFLLTRSRVVELASWNHFDLGSLHLYTHPDLEVTNSRQGERQLFLLGYLFDATDDQKGNSDILACLQGDAQTFADVLEGLKPYAGRYALIVQDPTGLKVIQDALALREVYYATGHNAAVCGSQPNLLARFSEPRLEFTQAPDVVDFCERHLPAVRSGRLWVGDATRFDGIRHLLPNHYLDVERRSAVRYWPGRAWPRLGLGEAVERASRFLEGTIKAAANRQPIMLAVTAGTDSRTLLAASRGISDRVYYFINMSPRMTKESADVRIPSAMCAKIGLPFHVHDVPQEVDSEFERIFYDNAFFASRRLLPAIFNVYYRHHPEKLNLLGVGEIGRALWGREPKNLRPYYLAYALGYRRSQYVTEQCERWLVEAQNVAKEHNVDLISLLLWEQLLGNWGAVGNSESDIAIEEFDPYDSHFMYETLLAVDDHAVNGDRHLIFREMIARMWPELLEFPFNPPDSAQKRVKGVLKRVGLYGLAKNLKYRWYFHRYGSAMTGGTAASRSGRPKELYPS